MLYGVGARLDQKPELLFLLRGVDQNELIASAGSGPLLPTNASAGAHRLDENDVAALFGIEMADTVTAEDAPSPQRKSEKSLKKKKPGKATAATTKKTNSRRVNRTHSGIRPSA